jgi:hypothetical protein
MDEGREKEEERDCHTACTRWWFWREEVSGICVRSIAK